ncbi:MAG: hypothetical protein ICV63_11745 [Coleofasciculus sp. Co-bin14]|nr:hypothetical protein [Coleofasciculus sp. Co-bin14]
MDAELLGQAKQNCIARAEVLLGAELAQVRAKHQARLNPSMGLVKLESFKLQLQQAKEAFSQSDDQAGLEIFSQVRRSLNNLLYNLAANGLS